MSHFQILTCYTSVLRDSRLWYQLGGREAGRELHTGLEAAVRRLAGVPTDAHPGQLLRLLPFPSPLLPYQPLPFFLLSILKLPLLFQPEEEMVRDW